MRGQEYQQLINHNTERRTRIMPFEILHFRGSDKILKEKKMTREIKLAMEYLNDCLYGTYRKGELLRQALQEMDWRQNGDLNVLDGRRYFYKGFRKRVAMDGSFSSYEYVHDALLRLQVGYDKKKIDMGIVLVTAQRSEKSKLGTTKDLVCQEIEMLYPTISLPVTIILFDLGIPGELYADAETKPKPHETELPDHMVIDPDGRLKIKDVPEEETTRKKPRPRSKKAALQDQQAA
jgi:hypothetical protein